MWRIEKFDESTSRWQQVMAGFPTRDDADRALVAYAQVDTSEPDLRAAQHDRCAGCGEPWPCSDSRRVDLRGDVRASHHR